MTGGEVILLISILLVTGIAIAGIILIRKQGDSATEDERFYNASSDTLSLKGLMRKLKSESAQYDIIAMEVSYGETSDDEDFVKKVDAFSRSVVKTVKGEFPNNYVGHQGYSSFWIAVPQADPNTIDRKMQNIANVIVAMNVKFARISVCYGYCCDSGSPIKKIEDANFAVKYAKRNGLVSVYFDSKVRELKENIIKVVNDPSLIEKEFDVVYQPILNADNGLVAGAEAKLVWIDDSGEPKYRFEEFYEEFVSREVADKVDLYALKCVSKILEYVKSKNKNVVVSMSVALSNLLDQEFAMEFKRQIERADIIKGNLLISISDDLDLNDMSMIEKIKNNLRSLGLQAELKNFAAKDNVYNQLSSDLFFRYMLSTVYTQDQLRQESEKVILFNMVDMVTGVKKSVVVTGVESANVVKFIRDYTDGTLIQGGFLFKDVSRGRLEDLITSESPVACPEIFSTEKIWGRPFRRRLNSPLNKNQQRKIVDEPVIEDKKVEEVAADTIIEEPKIEVVEDVKEPEVEVKVEEPKEEPKPEPVVEEVKEEPVVAEELKEEPKEEVKPEPQVIERIIEVPKEEPKPEPQVIEKVIYKTVEEPKQPEPVVQVVEQQPQQQNPYVIEVRTQEPQSPAIDLDAIKAIIRDELSGVKQQQPQNPTIDLNAIKEMIRDELSGVKQQDNQNQAPDLNAIKDLIREELGSVKQKEPQIIEKIVEVPKAEPIVEVVEEVKSQPAPVKPDPVVINIEDKDDEDEEEDDGEEEEIDVNEDTDREEERIAKLMAIFQKQFRDQWEAEMLKKYPELMRKHYERKMFAERIINLSPDNKNHYNKIKNAILSYEGVTNVTRKFFDTFVFDKKVIFKITVAGKSLKVYLALDPTRYPTGQFPHKDASKVKKHEKTPFMVKITSALSVKRLLILIDDLAVINSMKKIPDKEFKDYAKGMQFQVKKKKK